MVLGLGKEKGDVYCEPIMSHITLPMHRSKSLRVLLTLWAMRQALDYPLPGLPAVWELLEASFQHQLEGSCSGLPPQSCSQAPTLSSQLEPQLKTRRMILPGQEMGEVVSNPQHDPQHGQQCWGGSKCDLGHGLTAPVYPRGGWLI